MLTIILNRLLDQYGDGVYQIVQDACPNLTCCFDCRIDDFCHVEGCELVDSPIEKEALRRKLKLQEINSKIT